MTARFNRRVSVAVFTLAAILGTSLCLGALLGFANNPTVQATQPVTLNANSLSTFTHVDLKIDAGSQRLGAWQVEYAAALINDSGDTIGTVELVGIEGAPIAVTSGTATASLASPVRPASVYAMPPHYDPDALSQNRVILAAFSTQPAAELPTGVVPVARLHLHIRLDANQSAHIHSARLQHTLKPIAMGDEHANPIAATPGVVTGEN